MKKILKYFFVTLLVLIVSLMIFIFLKVDDINQKTDNSNAYAHTVIKQLYQYYTTHGDYPKTLNILEVYKDTVFVSTMETHRFHYTTSSKNGNFFSLSWSNGSMNWTGNKCTNENPESLKDENNVIRTYKLENGVVCVVTDLH